MKTVDAHQHYWDPARGDYGWIPAGNPILDRVYRPDDLREHLEACSVVATVLVQAAPSVEETSYLLDIADRTDHVAGVVGWIDFEDRSHLDHLRTFAGHEKFRGVRPMIESLADDDWMLREDIGWAFEALVELDLTFDALGFPRHLGYFFTLLKRYPDMRVVIDHCMKPQLRDRDRDPGHFRFWADGMARLAGETNACCKLSGIVTESDRSWTVDMLRPYISHVLDVFGPDRVMWGSDWPVCRLETTYEDWHRVARALTEGLGPEAMARIFAGTATEFYRLRV